MSSPKSRRLKETPSAFFGKAATIAAAFRLVIEAYLLFDNEGKGYMTRSNVTKTLQEFQKTTTRKTTNSETGSGILTEQRFRELDWDGNGTIDFMEFLRAFSGWVGMDDDESSGDEINEHAHCVHDSEEDGLADDMKCSAEIQEEKKKEDHGGSAGSHE